MKCRDDGVSFQTHIRCYSTCWAQEKMVHQSPRLGNVSSEPWQEIQVLGKCSWLFKMCLCGALVASMVQEDVLHSCCKSEGAKL